MIYELRFTIYEFMERKEPVRYRAKDMVMRLRPPYGDMVLRVHGLSSELLEPARQGNAFATLDAAKRLMAQTSALVELLELFGRTEVRGSEDGKEGE